MKKLITFATDNMSNAANQLMESCFKFGIDEFSWFKPEHIDPFFRKANKQVLDQPRGAGYWLWKPYIILKSMMEMKAGDVLVYADAGLYLNANIDHIIKTMDQDVSLFGNTHPHVRWCKAYCLYKMGMQDISPSQEQVQASVILFKITRETFDFVKEWLLWGQFKGMIDDTPSEDYIERHDFIEHRHDQAILTNLAVKYGYKFHWWAAQYNKGNKGRYNDKYPFPMFIHHGKRNDGSRK